MIKTKAKNTGFTIVEICVVCVILMLLLVPVFTLMSQGSSGTIHNRNEILAREYVANIIAFCNIIHYNHVKEFNLDELNKLCLENESKDFKIDLNDLGKNFEGLRLLIKDIKVKVKEFQSNNSNYKYKIVTVTLEWKEPDKKNSNKVIMSGMVTER